MSNILRGETKRIIITVNDSEGSPVNLSTLTGIICHVFQKGGKTIKKYSLNELEGYTDLTITDAVNGKFKVILQHSDTSGLDERDIIAEVKIEIENSDATDSNFFSTATVIVAVGKDAVTKFISSF